MSTGTKSRHPADTPQVTVGVLCRQTLLALVAAFPAKRCAVVFPRSRSTEPSFAQAATMP
ncbi:MAG: hypothetical protein NZ693_06635 [Thermoflexales bacterium]|nr:hypothetical protein [Thermoflexales bacterium]